MKKFCFTVCIVASLSLFCLFSCTKSSCLYDVIISLTKDNESVKSGVVMCYGHMHTDSVSEKTLTHYLGIESYPQFKDKVEELAVFSSVGESYFELAALKLYNVTDTKDGVLMFERRIKATKRASMFGIDTRAADNAFVKVYGNTVVLYMMDDNGKYKEKFEKLM